MSLPLRKEMLSTTSPAFSGAVMGGMELGQELAHGEAPDWTRVGIATGFGVVFNQPTRIGQTLERFGQQPVLRLLGREVPMPGEVSATAPMAPAAAETVPSVPAVAEAPTSTGPRPTAADWRQEMTERDRRGRAYPPTVADAADLKVMGPGITEDVFQGSHEMAPEAQQTATQAKQTEQSVIGPPQPEDIHAAVRRIHSDLFERYDRLELQKVEFDRWLADHPEAENAKELLATVSRELDELRPQVQAAYREVADRIGGQIVEPETPAAPPASVRTIDEQRNFIRNDVAQQLIRVGRPKPEAELAGQLVAERWLTRAALFNGARGTAEDLYRAEAPTILAPSGRTRKNARGAVVLNPTGIAGRDFLGVEGVKPILRLTKEANASTFIHESGHQFLGELMRDAAHEAAPARLKADAQTALKWLGAEKAEDIAVKHQEKFAKGFEQYLREGTAPSPGLAHVFAQFKQWLLAIYKTIKGLREPINEDIRQVFDRLLAEEPQRTVIAPEREQPRAAADVHENDTEASPEHADATLSRVDREREGFYASSPNAREVDDALARFYAENERVIEPGGETGAGRGGGEEVHPGSESAGPESGRGGPVPQHGSQRAGFGETRQEGDLVSGQRAEGGGRAHLSDVPLASHAAPDLTGWDYFNPGKLDNIRTENITSVEELQRAIDEAKDRIRGSSETMTDGELLDAAQELGFTPGELTSEKLAEAFGAVKDLNKKVLAFRMVIKKQSETVYSLMARVRDTNSDASVLEYARERQRFDMMMSVLSSVTTEWGRAGRAFRNLEGWDKVADMAEFLKEKTGRTLFQLKMEAKLGSRLGTPAKVASFLRDAQKRSGGGMLLEYFVNNLISGIATHVTYKIGNEITALMEAGPETLVASAIGRARAGLGRQGEYVRPGEALEQIKEIGRSIPKAIQGAVEAVKTGQPTLLPGQQARPLNPFFGDTALHIARNIQNDPVAWREAMGDLWSSLAGIKDGIVAGAQLVAAGGHTGAPLVGFHWSPLGQIPDVAFRGVPVLPIGSAVRIPGRLVAAIHSFDTIRNYSRIIAAKAYREGAERGLSGNALASHIATRKANPPKEWMEEAHKQAYAATLMAPGGKFVENFSKVINTAVDLPLLGQTRPFKFIDPFVHIGANVIQKAITERTPLGILSTQIRADLMGKNGNIAQDTAAARMLVGTALSIGFGSLAMEGYITGSGPSDPAKAAMWRTAGYQPHSVRVGDLWYQMNRLGPFGMHLSLAADLYDVVHDAAQGEFLTAAAHLQHAITQNIMDESFMKGPSDLIRAVDDPGRYGEGYLKNIASDFLPFSVGMAQMARAMDPHTRQARTIVEELKRKTPGMSETLFPRRDVWGEEIPNPQALGAAGVTAIYMTRISNDPINKAMLELGVAPSKVERKIRNIELNEQEYDDFARIAGRLTKMRLDTIVKSADWQTWSPHVRHDVIAEVIKRSRTVAEGQLFAKYPHIPRDAAEQRRKMKTGEIEPTPIH